MASRFKALLRSANENIPSLRGLGNGFWQPLLIAVLIAVPIMLILSSAESLSAEINNVETRSDANQVMIDELAAEKFQLIEQLEDQQTSESSKAQLIKQLMKQNAELQAQVDAYIAEEQAEEDKKHDFGFIDYEEKCKKYPGSWYCNDF